MKHISCITRYMAVFWAGISLMIACEQLAKADNFVFAPPAPTETNSLSDIFDDDVDVRSGATPGVMLGVGDSITWHYVYTKGGPGYMVLSTDLADIEELRLFGVAVGGTTVTVELQFSDLNGALIGNRYVFAGLVWGANNLLVSSADDVLGNLQPLGCIGDFELQVTVTAGLVNFTSADFLWEADDIEPCPVPEPMTMLLLSTGLMGVFTAVRSKRKGKK